MKAKHTVVAKTKAFLDKTPKAKGGNSCQG